MTPEKAMTLQDTIKLIDAIVGEAKALGHPRNPTESVDFAIAVVTLLQNAGADVLSTLQGVRPLIERATGEK